MKPIIDIDERELALALQRRGEHLEARTGSRSRALGARLLGYSLTVVPPGKRA